MKNLFLLVILALTSTVAFANNGMSAFNRKDYNEAYRIWSRSPDTAESQYGLGLLHYGGLGGPKNTERGLSLLRASSEKGYKPATEYLANVFEKAGDARNALRFLERLQAQERTLKTQERIVDAQKKLVKGPPTAAVDYCSAVKDLVTLGGTPERDVPEMCAVNDLPSPVSKEKGRQWLLTSFRQTPTLPGLATLSEELLNPRSASFNPTAIEEAIWVMDPNLSDSRIKEALRQNGKVNQDTCIALPFRDPDQRIRFSSYCALVVIAGQNKNPTISAREYISGLQGRAGMRLVERINRGLKLLGLQQDIVNSRDGLLLRLEAFRLLEDWENSFDLFQKNYSALIETKSQQVGSEIIFYLNKANVSAPGYDTRFAQINAKNLAQVIDLSPIDVDIKRYACAVLTPYIGKEFTNEQDVSGQTLNSLNQHLDSLCATAQMKKPDPIARPPARFDRPQQLIADGKSRNEQPQSTPQASPAASGGTSPDKRQNFDQDLFDCNQGKVLGCAPAAISIMSANPPSIYQTLTRQQKEEVAEKLLLNGAKTEDPASLAVLWDLYEFNLDSSKRPLAQKYLTILLAKGHPSGLLRQEIQFLPRELIGGLFGNILERGRFAAACARIKDLRDGNRLTAYDKEVANKAYTGPMCVSLRLGS